MKSLEAINRDNAAMFAKLRHHGRPLTQIHELAWGCSEPSRDAVTGTTISAAGLRSLRRARFSPLHRSLSLHGEAGPSLWAAINCGASRPDHHRRENSSS